VASAFGVTHPEPIAGGQGVAYGDDRVVLKPAFDVAEAEWLAGVLDALPETDDLRVIRPVRSTSGAWVVDGWAGWQRLSGATRAGACREALAVSARFHELVSAVPHSQALDTESPWAVGHRVAWGEETVPLPDGLAPVVERLTAWTVPLALPHQLVHGDLLGNVLYDDSLPPAVIDVSPAWRPARYADAIVVIDALGWSDASPDVLEPLADDEGLQLLVRAVLFRLASAVVLCDDDPARLNGEREVYECLADALARAAGW
jgi:uncharacterized protein (TIGR02569 family)